MHLSKRSVTSPENDHKAKAESLRLSRKVTSHSSRHVIYQTSLHGRETRREERGWWQEGEENFMQTDKDLLTHYLCFIAGHTYRIMTRGRRGEERRGDETRRDRMTTRRRGELYTNRQGSFNPLPLCFIAGHTHGMETKGRGEERR